MQGWVCSLSVVNSLHSKQLESPPNSLCCAGGAGGLCGMEIIDYSQYPLHR
jgi:hypothetical protein